MGRASSRYRDDEKDIKNLSQNMKGRDHLGNLDLDGRIILIWILKYGVKCELVLPDSGLSPVAGSCQHGNELQGFIKKT
jgi:hypothetical protein